MHVFDAFLLGALEGLTEFLPVSSTGHLILASHLLGIPDSTLLTSFEIAIQLGAIGAVLLTYWRSFLDLKVLTRLFVAFVPTAVIGLAFYSVVKHFLLGNELVVVWALLIGGLILIAFELFYKEPNYAPDSIKAISYPKAALIGLFQAVAIIPGVSRSAATIVGGLLLGIGRAAIIEFSFLLAVPTMGAAVALDVLKSYKDFTPDGIGLIGIGFVTAFAVAFLALRTFLGVVRRYGFIPFGVYRVLLALLFFFLVLH